MIHINPRYPNADSHRSKVTGRLEELNGHGGLTGCLWEPDGTKWTCRFKQEHLEQLSEAWMRRVEIVGTANVAAERERVLDVESLVLLEDGPSASGEAEAAPFWDSLSLEELAEQQNVKPVSDLDEISKLWPMDDDPDEMLRYIMSERQERRRAAQEGSTT